MSQQADHLYEFGPFRLDAEERLLARDGAAVPLTPKAFDLLRALVERHGHLVTKEELFHAVWPDSFVEESNLSSNIALIRKALGDGENGLKFIETVPKRGYRFVAEVREASLVSDNDLVPEKAEPPTPLASTSSPPASRWVRPVIFLAAGVIVGVAGWAVWRVAFRPLSTLSPPPRVVPFTSFSGNECCPSFSPDGNQIAFAWNREKGDNDDIYVKLIDAGSPLQLTTNPARDTTPAWSPDGRHIAFIRSAKDEKSLYLIPALGGQERKLCTLTPVSSGRAYFLSWSPDGKLLAFSEKNSPQEPDSIFLLSLESLEKRRLTSNPERRLGAQGARRLTVPTLRVAGDFDPAFSPDGKMLAFIRSNADADEIYLVPAAGGEPKRLTHDNRGIDEGLAWTSDGREIVFASNRAGSYNFWRIPIVGGAPERLAAGGDNVYAPTIARLGNRLAYTQYYSDLNIWRYEARPSSGRTNAPAKWISSTQLEASPHYSADGKRIVFTSWRSGNRELWVCDSDGSNPTQITSMGGPEVGSPGWSPDRSQICFDSNADGNKDIYVIGAGGGKARRLTVEASDEVRPSWSRDGKWIYFGSNRSGAWQVWKAPAEGGPAVQVTQQGGREAFEAPAGKFVYYTKGPGSFGLWRMPVAGGAEVQVLDQVQSGKWAALEQGIYFVNLKAAPNPTIEFFSFATARTARLAVIEKRVPLAPPGFAVSPDGRWILLVQDDQSESDIMLMENFR
jgi:Tol biopolymer transport system component/DNA-binding winged helix-turn-helix (wHTH) protein